jgi:hypothetical protein
VIWLLWRYLLRHTRAHAHTDSVRVVKRLPHVRRKFRVACTKSRNQRLDFSQLRSCKNTWFERVCNTESLKYILTKAPARLWRYFTSWCAISPCPNRCSREHLKTTSKPVSSGKKIHASHVTIMIRNVLSGSSSALCLRMAQCPQILTTRLLQTFRFWQVPGRMPIQFQRIACLTHEIEVLGLLSRNTIAQFLVPAFSPSHIFGRIGPHFRKHCKN